LNGIGGGETAETEPTELGSLFPVVHDFFLPQSPPKKLFNSGFSGFSSFSPFYSSKGIIFQDIFMLNS